MLDPVDSIPADLELPPALPAAPAAPPAAAPPRRQKLLAILPLAFLLIIAAGARFVELRRFPVNLSCDEADNLREIYQINTRGNPPLFGLDWKPQPALSQHIAALSLRIFGDSPAPHIAAMRHPPAGDARNAALAQWRETLRDLDDIAALRLPSALFSLLALLPFYFIARRTVSRTAVLAATLLLALNPMYLNFSRSGWENVHICLATLLAVWGAVRLHERTGKWYVNIPITALGAAWGLYGYFSGRAVPLILAAGALILLILTPRSNPTHRTRRAIAALRWLAFWALLAGPALVLLPAWLLGSEKYPRFWLPAALLAIPILWALTLSWYEPLARDLWRRAPSNSPARLFASLFVAAALAIVLFLPQCRTIIKDWQRFTGRMREVSAIHVPMPADGFETRVRMIRANTWQSLLAPFRPINNRPRYAPLFKPLLQPALGFLALVGMLSALARFGRHTWWWLMLAIPFVVTQMITRGTPDGARGIALIPPLYYFVAVGLDRFRNLWYASPRRLIPLILAAFVTLVAWRDIRLYREWIGNENIIAQRGPDVRLDEFPDWAIWQYLSLENRDWTHNTGEWRDLRNHTDAADIARSEIPKTSPPEAPK